MTRMIIANLVEKIKFWSLKLTQEAEAIFATLLVFSLAFFGLGLYELFKLERERPPIVISHDLDSVESSTKAVDSVAKEGKVLASKNGQRFYYPWCSGANRIKEENKIYFKSVAEAQLAGYTQALNCH